MRRAFSRHSTIMERSTWVRRPMSLCWSFAKARSNSLTISAVNVPDVSGCFRLRPYWVGSKLHHGHRFTGPEGVSDSKCEDWPWQIRELDDGFQISCHTARCCRDDAMCLDHVLPCGGNQGV